MGEVEEGGLYMREMIFSVVNVFGERCEWSSLVNLKGMKTCEWRVENDQV